METTYVNDLSEGLRLWLDEGHLSTRRAVLPVVDLGELKRNAAQRLMAAQRGQTKNS
jgi:hypothetical protein